jgi:Glycosyl transferase family 2
LKKRILIGVPVRQKPRILAAFLRGLEETHLVGLEASFSFIDDNTFDESSKMLRQFQQRQPRCDVHRVASEGDYLCNDSTHHWNEALIWKVAAFKNELLSAARDGDYDALFLVDSDVVLPAQLLGHLAALNKPVVSEVFWTSWHPNEPKLPQVWLADDYTLYSSRRGEHLSGDEKTARASAFLKQLRRPGVYRVGGLGACTLISRDAIAKGVSFSEVDNISMLGEDRHFCIRARALGIELWADTRFPPLHVYRDDDLRHLEAHRARCAADFLESPKLTLSMVVHNEANRWLRDALRAHLPFLNEAVVIDDASTDETADVVQRELEGLPLRLIRNRTSRFANEIELRQQQWEEALASNPDWILNLDADEILEPRASVVIPELVKQTDYAVFGFALYDFWNSTHYREDDWWRAHAVPRPFLTRYTPDFRYRWNDTPQHCGRMPANVLELNSAAVDLRVKHMGWSKPEERERKHARYQALDPEARFGVREQYDSILDPAPNLVAWQDVVEAS